MLVCEECGGKNIQIMAWVNANTHEYIEDGWSEVQDNWCDDCESHVNFIDEEDFLTNDEEE